jgi:Zn-dependent protease
MWSTTLFTIRGIDVKVHATFAIIVAIGATQWGAVHGLRGALFGAAFTLALFACVLLHELGHSLVAQRFGLKVKEVVLLPIGGIASLVGKPQSPKQEIAIAIAGPFVNIVLALALVAGLWFSGAAANLSAANWGKLAPSWQTFLFMLTAGNASLALFNLLPFFPLDGGRVLRALLSLKLGEQRATRWAAGLGQLAGVAMAGFALVSGQIVLALIGFLVLMAASRERAAATLHPPLQALTAADVAEVPAIELEATARIGEAIPQLLRSAQDAFPIVADGVLLGVVLRGDLVLAAQRPELDLQSIRTLAQQVPELPSHLSAAEALKLLEEMEAPLGVVVTPDYPLGFISHAQVFSKLAQLPSTAWPAKTSLQPNLRPGGSPDLPRNPA